MRVWFNPCLPGQGGKDPVSGLKEKKINLNLQTDEPTGMLYWDVYEAQGPNPLVDLIPAGLVHLVTHCERIYTGFQRDGVYRLNGAELRLTTEIGARWEGAEREVQVALIKGPSIKSVLDIYTRVRQGKLSPAEDWSGNVCGHLSDENDKFRRFLETYAEELRIGVIMNSESARLREQLDEVHKLLGLPLFVPTPSVEGASAPTGEACKCEKPQPGMDRPSCTTHCLTCGGSLPPEGGSLDLAPEFHH